MHQIYTDGASRGNPGPSGAGGVIFGPGGNEIIAEIKEYLGTATNNLAEYTAVKLTLERAIALGLTEVEVNCDSKLVVEQITGRWKINNPVLKEINNEIKQLLPNFGIITFKHIYRNLNGYADRLANEAINEAL
jgi:ribonuclease HI